MKNIIEIFRKIFKLSSNINCKIKYINFYDSMNKEYFAQILLKNKNWIIANIPDLNQEIVLLNGKEFRKDSRPYFELMEKK